MIRFVPATAGHAHLVAANMRESDRLEVQAGWNAQPKEAILHALTDSQFSQTCYYGLEVLAIYGVAKLSILSDSAQAWCFGTMAIDRHPLIFARASRRELERLFQYARVLTNVVDVNDHRAHRWLEFLGATYVLQPKPRGGRLFEQFILARESKMKGQSCQQA